MREIGKNHGSILVKYICSSELHKLNYNVKQVRI